MTYNVSSGTLNTTIPYHTMYRFLEIWHWRILRSWNLS